jgi:hypothetical protein
MNNTDLTSFRNRLKELINRSLTSLEYLEDSKLAEDKTIASLEKMSKILETLGEWKDGESTLDTLSTDDLEALLDN